MVGLEGFNAEKIAPQAPMEILPPGEYVAVIVDSNKKPTKSGEGAYIEFKMQIVEGQYKNRFIWDRLNLWNNNETAVQIAQSTLSAICHAVGVLQPRDTSQLHNKPLVVTLKTRKNNETGELSNDVKGYKNRNAAQQTQPAAKDVEDKAPWA